MRWTIVAGAGVAGTAVVVVLAITLSGEDRPATSAGADATSRASAATATYRAYVERQTDLLTTRTAAFTAAVKSGDVAKTRALFAYARAPYEAIEPIAESLGTLDPRIDARINDIDEGTPWTGFHRIEQAAWVEGSVASMGPVAAQLTADVADLVASVKRVKLAPAQIAQGAVALLDEVSKSKITGEEDRYSHTDLSDFQANVDGAKEAFVAVRPIMGRRATALTARIDDAFAAVDRALQPYRTADGYVSFAGLTEIDKRTLSGTIDRLAEPLSKVPALLSQS